MGRQSSKIYKEKHMNILFHVGVGNTDRPDRWTSICVFYSKLARVFESFGHNCMVYCHPSAVRDIYKHHIISPIVGNIPFNPDKIFTWNGISNGDQAIIAKYGRSKFVFAELGFLDHYNTCYFDFSGTNALSMNLVEDLSVIAVDHDKMDALVKMYSKPQLTSDRYIFVPFQDERDTQITQLSPFKTMDQLLTYVCDLYNYDRDLKILYKQHPHARSKVSVKDSRLVEVTGDVHHYLKDAEMVIGCNSTVLFETLLYHARVFTCGIGTSSRTFSSDDERIKYVLNCHMKQVNLNQLGDANVIKNSWMYQRLIG